MVLLWDIFNGGGIPYEEIDYANLFRHLKSGGRLPRPDGCLAELPDFERDYCYRACRYTELMLLCWKFKPFSRPDFADIFAGMNRRYKDLTLRQFER